MEQKPDENVNDPSNQPSNHPSNRASSLMLSKADVEQVARLARLALTAAEVTSLQAQLSAVLKNFEQISNVDTEGLVPLRTPVEISLCLRPDEVSQEVEPDQCLSGAPEKSGRLFKVPPVV